jgi:2-polyprenyl-6-methoxyphenol hydroxylase-like FAD-dependent oxidoreductase
MTTHTTFEEPMVLVVGAGPTGLFLALMLTRQGVRVRLIDQKSGPSQESRAMAVHARTLEFYRQLGLSEALVELGIPTGDAHVWVNGQERVNFSLKNMGEGLSPYPFLLTLAQDVHERFLIEQLTDNGVYVEWNTALKHLSQDETRVTATLSLVDGLEEQVEVPYLVGCDGASSATRQALSIGFGGGTSEGLDV